MRSVASFARSLHPFVRSLLSACELPTFAAMSAPADVAASSAAAAEDQVAPLASPPAASTSAVSRARVVHGHKPSTMGSMDLSEESRDTVEVKDSDKWSVPVAGRSRKSGRCKIAMTMLME